MEEFNCNIWEFIVFGFTCLCGGLSLGVMIGEHIFKKESEEVTADDD